MRNAINPMSSSNRIGLPDQELPIEYIVSFRRIAAGIAAFAGVATLVGMASGVDLLTRWIPTSTSMNPVTAIMLILGSVILVLPERARARGSVVLAIVLTLAGALKIAQVALGHPVNYDQRIATALHDGVSALPDPLAPNTAAAFLFLGIALLLGRSSHPARALTAQTLSAVATIIPIFALIGFTLGAATINQFTFNQMAVNSAVGLVALGFGIMSLTTSHGVMRLLVYNGPAGSLARKALPICLVIPPLLGIVRLRTEAIAGFSTGDGVVIMVTGNILLSLALLWGGLILLLRSDAELRARNIAIARSEENYRVAERVSKTGHWQFETATRTLYWSPEFRVTLRLSDNARSGIGAMLALIHPDDAPVVRQQVRDALRSDPGWTSQLRLRHPDGTVQHIRSSGVCTRDARGALVSVFGAIADITELELARQGAEAATHAQAAFLANMSHEIRTPLNGVMGFIDLLLDSKLDTNQRRYLTLVNDSAQSLLKLLNDILDLSKVEAGQMEIAPQATDLRRIVRHAARLMAPAAEQSEVALSVVIAPHFPSGVMVDGARFRQILLNLLGNALKFTSNGSVIVTLQQHTASDGTALMQTIVTDSGVGIAADRLDAVFQPFVQADNSTSRRFGGSGLGLSISRQLAEQMGGTIELDSTLGVGTRATLTLPLEVAVTEASVGHERPAALVNGGDEGIGELVAASVAGGPLSILLAEDIALNRELVSSMLQRLGHRVDFAKDGFEAVAAANRLAAEPDAWDLILMDIQMPVLNGWQATARIRALGGAAGSIPIIALSANAYAAEIQQSMDSGMDDHIVKPICFKDLHRVIERWGRGARIAEDAGPLIKVANG